MRSAYLQHHGILGQRWGVRRFEDENGHLTAAGKERYGKGGKKQNTEDEDKEKFWTKDRVKKAVKVGAIAAGTVLVAYGGYRLAKSGKIENITIIGRQKINRLLNKNYGGGDLLGDIQEVAKETGFKVREKPISILDSTKSVNPGYSTGKPEYTNNCFSCVTADCMNRLNDGKGLMVQAREATPDEISKRGNTFNYVANAWKDSSIEDIVVSKSDTAEGIRNSLEEKIRAKCKTENGLGIIRLKNPKDSKIGHYLKFELKNGEVYLSDSQSGTMKKVDLYLNAIANGKISRGIEFMQCDGLEINPEIAKQIVKGL